ncbi:ATP-binding protein [Burkholderiaceae bacterium DAT-1]|nr:ATP-binding protein [Burkholderiaceae bacterium DAT-1]
MDKKDSALHFKVSAGLKRIIGRDLITNDFVAVFELVKNSFDAHADRVDVIFDEDRIFIIDNGKGMSYDDLIHKWLFVAYSAKKDGSEDDEIAIDYRDRLDGKRAYAGSKGVGRFSCDRLGSALRLQTRTALPGAPVEILEIDWNNFEEDDRNEFVNIQVQYSSSDNFSVPDGCYDLEHGTVLEITSPRESWPRIKLISLKSALAKLINPFSGSANEFKIFIHVKRELEVDNAVKPSRLDWEADGENEDVESHGQIVNGKVENFIFETLREKTTHLDVRVSEDGEKILSELSDRGEIIYQISEPNNYGLLGGADFSCNLFYLNRAAKTTFRRRMGISSVKFGSVFLFRNGFRVFPVGDEGNDTFGIDRRKQQGYARYLGSRDIVGRIDVKGSERYFRESTSRDQGLIETPAYLELIDCFWEKCLKRLENYVVGVTWQDSLDADKEDISRLTGDKARARIIELVSKVANGRDVDLLYYSRNLVSILNEKSEDFERSIEGLKLLADKSGSEDLFSQIRKAELRYQELKQAEQLARAQAEKERKAREEAERRAREAEKEKGEAQRDKRKAEEEKRQAEIAYAEEKKRNLFLTSVTSVDHDTIVNLHHQIGIYSADIHHLLANQVDKLKHGERIEDDDLLNLLEQLSFKNQQILAVSRFATKANFRLDSEQIEADLVTFVSQYVDQVCSFYNGDGLNVQVRSSAKGLIRKFKPIEISILIDNLVNNAEKAGASSVFFDITQPSSKQIEITVTDDGRGLDGRIMEPDRVFEKGFSTTDGSGLGLYHVSYILDQMGGDIGLNPSYENGTQFVMRIVE